ncbi:hypothetical protein D3C85_1242230 [compost metagenome]
MKILMRQKRQPPVIRFLSFHHVIGRGKHSGRVAVFQSSLSGAHNDEGIMFIGNMSHEIGGRGYDLFQICYKSSSIKHFRTHHCHGMLQSFHLECHRFLIPNIDRTIIQSIKIVCPVSIDFTFHLIQSGGNGTPFI